MKEFYETDTPCEKGHTQRYKHDHSCVLCTALGRLSTMREDPDTGDADKKPARTRQTFIGGKPCRRGHDPAIRYKKGGMCVACVQEDNEAKRLKKHGAEGVEELDLKKEVRRLRRERDAALERVQELGAQVVALEARLRAFEARMGDAD